MTWTPSRGEEVVGYDPLERAKYEAGEPSEYDAWAWPEHLRVGRNTHGCFAEICVQAHLERLGFSVLVSEPRYPDEGGFLVVHYAGKRRSRDPAFTRMQEHFPDVDLDAVADEAAGAKLAAGVSSGGGDPDLFVFGHAERFFVEVKDDDQLRTAQLESFPILEARLGCEVRLVRIEPRA